MKNLSVSYEVMANLKFECGDPYLNDEGKLCVDMMVLGERITYYLNGYNLDGTYKLGDIVNGEDRSKNRRT